MVTARLSRARADAPPSYSVCRSSARKLSVLPTALLPGSHAGIDDGKPLTSKFRVGRTLEARVLRIDGSDRKMALTCLEPEEELPEAGRSADGSRSWTDKETSVETEEVGSFGALLKAALTDEDAS